MPYCPKCDMEFIEGIAVCSDCGGTLAESVEAARTMKASEKRERFEQMAGDDPFDMEDQNQSPYPEPTEETPDTPIAPTRIYMNKAQKHEDLKSSATAFLIVGIVMLASSAVCWTGIVNLPMNGVYKFVFQSAITIMGVLALIVALGSAMAAKKLAPQIEGENRTTQHLIQWFVDTYSGDDIDRTVDRAENLTPEEMSLKRFAVIQDYLTTNHDLPDQAYVDALSEEIYDKLYE